jgi:hypothetical protein
MALKINDSAIGGFVALSSLNVTDVFQHHGDTYMLLDRHGENGCPLTFNLTRRYVTGLSEAERVLPLDATLEIHGPQQTLTAMELAECRMGRKIQAIKLYRERTGVGLLESKQTVEREMSRHGIVSPPFLNQIKQIFYLTR